MTDNLAVLFGHERDDAVAVSSQFLYEFSLGRATERRGNDLVNSFPVLSSFITYGNHHAISARSGTASKHESASVDSDNSN